MLFLIAVIIVNVCTTHAKEFTLKFRIDAGTESCFYESMTSDQMLEIQYQVVDGQQGDLDISFTIKGPDDQEILFDYKKSENSIILDLEDEGNYTFCMDNTHSIVNSKLVYLYILIEGNTKEDMQIDSDEEEVLEWMGTNAYGEPYYMEVSNITESLKLTLKNVVKSHHLLNLYGMRKSRDSYLAENDTFIVDVWSSFQITFMLIVGLLQVYTIKQLFKGSSRNVGIFC